MGIGFGGLVCERKMDLDSIECVSSSDLDEDEIHHHQHPHQQLQHPHHHVLHPHLHSEFSSSNNKSRNASNNVVNGNNNNANNIVGPTAITPATSVHELLECPVCTNSMYPPIHQVSIFPYLSLVSVVELVFLCKWVFVFVVEKIVTLDLFVGFDWGSGVWSIIWNWVLKDLLDRERIVDCLDCFWFNLFGNDIMLRREF